MGTSALDRDTGSIVHEDQQDAIEAVPELCGTVAMETSAKIDSDVRGGVADAAD